MIATWEIGRRTNFVCLLAANMFLIPYGMKLGSGVTVRNYIARSMVPVFLGNMISATFFLAGSYAFCYGISPAHIRLAILSNHQCPCFKMYASMEEPEKTLADVWISAFFCLNLL